MKIDLESAGIRVKLDDDDQKKPGAKFFSWEMKGVPVRIECGERDINNNVFVLADRISSEKNTVERALLVESVQKLLVTVQNLLFKQAQDRYDSMTHKIPKLADFGKIMAEQNGIFYAGWCGSATCERELKPFQGSIRCLIEKHDFTACFHCDQASTDDVIIAKSY